VLLPTGKATHGLRRHAEVDGPLLRSRAIAAVGTRDLAEKPAFAYLVGYYPTFSQTFLLREVEALRGLGARVETFSVRRSGPEHILTDADRQASDTTYAILPPRAADLAVAHLRALVTAPHRYARALSTALRMRRPGVRGTLWALFYLAEATILWDRLRRLGLRHVHAQFASNATDVALLAAELGGRGWTWSFALHGPVEFYDVSGFRLAEKARRAAFVACISDFARSQLQAFLSPDDWDRIEVVPVGVEPERFAPAAPAGETTGEPLRVLTVGRLAGVKGQAVLLDALAELRRRGVAARLVIAGEGPERARLERRAARLGVADAVEFAGRLGHDRVAALYADADLFCTSSFAEGVPVVLIEAMASGLPVVATRIMGIPELVEHETHGLLVPPARADALADALERLARRPEERRAMGEAGRERVLAEFGWPAIAAQTVQVYETVLAARR
jgi:glycosyltransferase involved in cell wall biosynthesis